MIGRFKKFLKGRSSPSQVSHRQIDPRRTAVTSVNRGGRVRHADYEYGMRRVVNLVQDAFMDFLSSALYFDYMVESFNVNPGLG